MAENERFKELGVPCAALEICCTKVPETGVIGTVPVPERLAVCGLPVALSLTLIEAERPPLAEGVKVTLIEHVPPAATELPQVFVAAKSEAFVPVIAMLVTLRGAPPVLLRLTV